MKILFTGASSFTGMWFVQELVNAGHEVLALIRRKENEYSGVRNLRLQKVKSLCPVEYDCVFGTERFLEVARSYPADLFCHHAADDGRKRYRRLALWYD